MPEVAPQRTSEAETYAEQARAIRADLAYSLRAARRAVRAGDLHPDHLRLLRCARYAGNSHGHQHPNPDRASACQRHTERTRQTLENVRAVLEVDGSPRGQTALLRLQVSADLYALLAATAPH
ncbi:hypothetical protein [Deinococcus aestuarii]|uniref:hypothetical protein n=1 Tax=Deinococcus aestuarii TaxID=2774531 RepID=UPI001C0AFA0C|nr:hypothetical protein [Deinococcus aestuarii]